MPIIADAAVAIRGDLSRLAGDLKKGEAQVKGSMARIGGSIKSALAPGNLLASAGLLLGTKQIVDFFADSVTKASELEQSVGAVDSVLGEAAGTIERFGDTAAEEFGLSRQQVNQFGAVLGAQLQSFGFEAGEAAEQAVTLQQRGADLAATFGGPVSQAIEAISSFMRGERDPIERYGVSIKEVDINARVAALGLDTSTTAAEKNSKAIAALDILMEQTASSAGQFGRESESLAGSTARLQANLENAQAELGERLIPLFLDLANFANDEVIPAIEGVAGAIDYLTEETAGAADADDPLEAIFGLLDDISDSGYKFRQWVDQAVDGIDEVSNAAGGMTDTWASAWGSAEGQAKAGMYGINTAIEDIAPEVVETAEEGAEEVAGKFGEIPEKGADAMLEEQWRLKDAAKELVTFMETAISPMKEVAELEGFLTSKRLAEALDDNNPLVREKAREMKNAALERLDELAEAGYGKGSAFAGNVADGIRDSAYKAAWEAQQMAQLIRNQFPGSEPKDPNSPLAGVTDAWGMVDVIAGGIRRHAGVLPAAMQDALSSIAMSQWAGGLPSSLPFSFSQPSQVSSSPGIGGGNTYVVNLEEKMQPVRSPRDIATRLRRAGELGLLPGSDK